MSDAAGMAATARAVLLIRCLAISLVFGSPSLQIEPTPPLVDMRAAARRNKVLPAIQFRVKRSAAKLEIPELVNTVLGLNFTVIGAPEPMFREFPHSDRSLYAKHLAGWWSLRLNETTPPHAVLDAIELTLNSTARPYLEFIGPELEKSAAYVTNDPRLRPSQLPFYHVIGLPFAWNITSGSPTVVVQIVDSGFQEDHEDLQLNKWVNAGEICKYVPLLQTSYAADRNVTNALSTGSQQWHRRRQERLHRRL